MPRHAIIPAAFADASRAAKMSPAIQSGGFAFLNGMAGGDLTGKMHDDPDAQFCNRFDKIGRILLEVVLEFEAVVEMKSYHFGQCEHFDALYRVRLDHFSEPRPAWTAVEVVGLRREGAVVEIRVVAMSG